MSFPANHRQMPSDDPIILLHVTEDNQWRDISMGILRVKESLLSSKQMF